MKGKAGGILQSCKPGSSKQVDTCVAALRDCQRALKRVTSVAAKISTCARLSEVYIGAT